MNKRRKRKEGVARVESALALSQFIHLFVPFGIGQSQQCDLVAESRKGEGDVRGLFDPVVEGGEEEDVFYFVLRISYWVLQDRLDRLDGLREGFF